VYGREEYSNKDFWDSRFNETSGFFDWYVGWTEMKPIVTNAFPPSTTEKLLMVGCGNSKLTEDMHKDGYSYILNIDISQVVLDKMHEQYIQYPQFEYAVMDATRMPLKSDEFDLVIDKGTFDALACGKEKTILRRLVQEMVRVTSINGSCIIITHGTPEKRMPLFEDYLKDDNVEISYEKLELSKLSQLINILRVKLKDKPLSHAMKDKDTLKEALLEMVAIERKRQEEEKPRNAKEKLIQLMLRAKRKREQEEKEKNGEGSNSSPSESLVVGECKPLEEKSEDTKASLNYHPQRQDFCMLYFIKKLNA